MPKVASEVSGRHNSMAMYTSQEIGAAPDTVPLPFPDAKVLLLILPTYIYVDAHYYRIILLALAVSILAFRYIAALLCTCDVCSLSRRFLVTTQIFGA